MSPSVQMLLVFNNYFHDVATATLLSSAVILWVLGRQAEKGGPAERKAFARAYPTLTKFAWGALIWIILGGIPRTIFIKQMEFIPDQLAEKGLYADLLVKHAFMFTAVIVGAILWVRMAKVAKRELASGDE
jgi:hypothetical protein